MTRRDAVDTIAICAFMWVIAFGVQMIQKGMGW